MRSPLEVKALSGASAVRHGRFGSGEHGPDPVLVSDIEEHPFRNNAAYLPWLHVDYEEGLLPVDFLRIGAFLSKTCQDYASVVAEADPELNFRLRAGLSCTFSRAGISSRHVQRLASTAAAISVVSPGSGMPALSSPTTAKISQGP